MWGQGNEWIYSTLVQEFRPLPVPPSHSAAPDSPVNEPTPHSLSEQIAHPPLCPANTTYRGAHHRRRATTEISLSGRHSFYWCTSYSSLNLPSLISSLHLVENPPCFPQSMSLSEAKEDQFSEPTFLNNNAMLSSLSGCSRQLDGSFISSVLELVSFSKLYDHVHLSLFFFFF